MRGARIALCAAPRLRYKEPLPMKLDPLVFVLPLYGALIGGEWLLGRRRQPLPARRWEDLLVNLGAGLGQLATDVFLGLLYTVPYAWLLRHVAIVTLSARSPLVWVGSFVAVDFLFYWQHRVSHRVSLFWAAHVVHHQGEHYNLSLALRQPWFSAFVNWVYYTPLAIAGVPLDVFLGSVLLNLFYQFFLHTRLAGGLGALGRVLNTPSHHRVHHGRNARYLDANYGGVLVVWDRLFGTFRPESEEPRFGSVEPFRSWNSVLANFTYFSVIWRKTRACRRLRDRLLAWVRPPEWHPADMAPVAEAPAAPRPGVRRCVYATLLHAEALIAAVALVSFKTSLGVGARLVAIGFVVATLAIAGGLLDGRRWAVRIEWGRRACLAGAVFFVLVGTR